jgi:hypothetical protein
MYLPHGLMVVSLEIRIPYPKTLVYHVLASRANGSVLHADPDPSMQRHNTENSKQIFPVKELSGPNFHIHVSVSDLYVPTINLPILLQENM